MLTKQLPIDLILSLSGASWRMLIQVNYGSFRMVKAFTGVKSTNWIWRRLTGQCLSGRALGKGHIQTQPPITLVHLLTDFQTEKEKKRDDSLECAAIIER